MGYERFSRPFQVRRGHVTILHVTLVDPDASSGPVRTSSAVVMGILIWMAVKYNIS